MISKRKYWVGLIIGIVIFLIGLNVFIFKAVCNDLNKKGGIGQIIVDDVKVTIKK